VVIQIRISPQRHEGTKNCGRRSLDSAKTARENTALQRQIEAVDAQIDRLVYELYGLTDDEIEIVERATHKEN